MRTCLLFACAIFTAIPVFAHHSLAAFDLTKTVRITGTVSELMFVNPHVTFSVDARNADGTVTRWKIETGSPNGLMRGGFTKATIANGTTIVVDAYPAKDGSLNATGRALILPDGREINIRDNFGYNLDKSCVGPDCIRVAGEPPAK